MWSVLSTPTINLVLSPLTAMISGSLFLDDFIGLSHQCGGILTCSFSQLFFFSWVEVWTLCLVVCLDAVLKTSVAFCPLFRQKSHLNVIFRRLSEVWRSSWKTGNCLESLPLVSSLPWCAFNFQLYTAWELFSDPFKTDVRQPLLLEDHCWCPSFLALC